MLTSGQAIQQVQPRNTIRIYGNGMTAFRRQFKISPQTTSEQSIPVKENQVWSLLGTLDFFGKDVNLAKPPSFVQGEKNAKLNISCTGTYQSIFTQFSGSQIRIAPQVGAAFVGILAGVESQANNASDSGSTSISHYVVFVDEEGAIRRLDLSDVSSFTFVNEADQVKLKEALKRNYQSKIEPGNTLVNFSLQNTSEEERVASYDYALPGSPWASTYRLKRKDGKWSLKCYAVVHNKTQFDWNDVYLTCVNGEPNYFPTTIADAIEVDLGPAVDVVSRKSRGVVDIQEGYNEYESAGRGRSAPRAACFGAQGAQGPMASPSLVQCAAGDANLEAFGFAGEMEEAGQAEAVTSQVGDFLLMECSEPQTIPARSSALVKMYSKELGNGSSVLYYKAASDSSFPFRSVQFTNDTGLPLAKGVVTVIIDGVNSGESMLQAAKPGDLRLLAHTLETGVTINRSTKSTTYKVDRIKIFDGAWHNSKRATSRTTYTIRNKMDESFSLLVEHVPVISESTQIVKKGEESISQVEELPDGSSRVTVELKAKESITLTVVETRVYEETLSLSGADLVRLLDDKTILSNERIQAVLDCQQRCEEISRQVSDLKLTRTRQQQMFDRANQSIANAHGEDELQIAKDRREAELSLREIDGTSLPRAEKSLHDARNAYHKALRAIHIDQEISTASK